MESSWSGIPYYEFPQVGDVGHTHVNVPYNYLAGGLDGLKPICTGVRFGKSNELEICLAFEGGAGVYAVQDARN